MLKRYKADLLVVANDEVGEGFFMLTLQHNDSLPEIAPGQFVEIRVQGAQGVLLRRPISIHEADRQNNSIRLLIRRAGEGTRTLSAIPVGSKLDVLFPLGNGFDLDAAGERPMLVGGGVGVAPLLQLGKDLAASGRRPTFVFGAKTSEALLRIDEYQKIGEVIVATEDGSLGTRGFVTDVPALAPNEIKNFTCIMQCGPTPMMKAVAKRAQQNGVRCFASLENTMACGFGVCLCCVTDTINGNKRVCADGPVFDVNDLKW